LVLPVPLAKSERLNYATRELAANVDPDLVREFAVFSPNHVPDWARPDADGGPIRIIGDDELQEKADQAVTRLAAAIADASVPRSAPAAVTLEALHEAQEQEDLTIAGELARKAAGARHGLPFGRVVHRALELLLGRVYSSEREAVQVAARELGASNHLREAQEDVKRSVEALRRLEVIRPEWTLRTEYPLCFFDASGKLVNGVIDLLAIGAERVLLLDFKTDHARPGDLQAAYPIYARQLELYERAIRQTGLLAGRDLQKGLLFSETGEVRWAGGLV
jgi:ATP-dependent exoDNAse (exonuclease V) beta subunit